MPVTELNHYFVRANDLEQTKRFYCDVLGFEVMKRPDFPFPGYWLGVNGKIQVHMGPHGIPNAELYYLGTTPKSATDNTGVVDHIAFLATEPEKFAKRFDEVGDQLAQPLLPGVPALPDVRQGSERADRRAELLRHRQAAGLGRERRELRGDGAGAGGR